MRLLVGIPAFDEEKSITAVVRAIPREVAGIASVRVLVVDDGSRDATARLAEDAGAFVLRHGENQGLGNAFRTMVRYAVAEKFDVLVTLDGDGQFDASQIPELLRPIQQRRSLVATASRFLDPALEPAMPWIKKWGNRRVAGMVSSLTGRRYADVSCGFRAYSRDALLLLTVHHPFTYTHETFLDLAAKRIPFAEVPLVVRGVREHGKSKMASSVFRYGIRTASILARTYRDHRPFEACAWLALPLALLAAFLFTTSFAQWQATGSWLKWAALSAAGLAAVATGLLFVGFLADILTRLRMNQEEILFWLRRGA
jgi:glycosyltransferase involved in cell wall biosynthesis